MVPGLRCLSRDLQQVAPDHVHVVTSMIKEMEDKLEASKLSDRWVLQGHTPHLQVDLHSAHYV